MKIIDDKSVKIFTNTSRLYLKKQEIKLKRIVDIKRGDRKYFPHKKTSHSFERHYSSNYYDPNEKMNKSESKVIGRTLLMIKICQKLTA